MWTKCPSFYRRHMSLNEHYNDVMMGAIASQITSLTIVYSTVYSDADERKHQSPASLAFVGNSPLTGEFPAQMASNEWNVSIWWRYHEMLVFLNKSTLNHAVAWHWFSITPPRHLTNLLIIYDIATWSPTNKMYWYFHLNYCFSPGKCIS